jgi:hypothetical protein
MQDFVIVLAYLIIAMIAFAAPVIIFLLSVNSAGIQIAKNKAETEKKVFRRILAIEINKEDLKISAISNGIKQLKRSARRAKKRIYLLTPKVQITKIFIAFFASLIFIMADMVVRNNRWNFKWHYKHDLSICLIILSIAFLIAGIWFLKLVSWEIISTKQTIEEEGRYTQIKHSQIATGQPENDKEGEI